MKNFIVLLTILLSSFNLLAQSDDEPIKYKVIFKDKTEKIIDVTNITDEKIYYWNEKGKKDVILKNQTESIELLQDKKKSNNNANQLDYKIEKVDSITKTKDQIYSDTKMFIAEYWKSAQNVIQNDDKTSGMILVKGATIQHLFFQLNDHTYIFDYMVHFLMKEGKYKIIVSDIYNSSAMCQTYAWPLIKICDGCEFPGLWKTGLNEKRYTTLQESVKNELNIIVSEYDSYIKKVSQNNNW